MIPLFIHWNLVLLWQEIIFEYNGFNFVTKMLVAIATVAKKLRPKQNQLRSYPLDTVIIPVAFEQQWPWVDISNCESLLLKNTTPAPWTVLSGV